MALVTTPGAGDADSYASVAQADQYHLSRGNAAWTGTTEAKEAALRRATSWIDATYHQQWPGVPLYGRTQALDWPRSGAVDYHGSDIIEDTIPPEVEAATMEAALVELVTPGDLVATQAATTAGTVIKETVGPISVSYQSGSAEYLGTVWTVENALMPLIGYRDLPVILVV